MEPCFAEVHSSALRVSTMLVPFPFIALKCSQHLYDTYTTDHRFLHNLCLQRTEWPILCSLDDWGSLHSSCHPYVQRFGYSPGWFGGGHVECALFKYRGNPGTNGHSGTVFAITPFLLYRYGAVMRQNSPFARQMAGQESPPPNV